MFEPPYLDGILVTLAPHVVEGKCVGHAAEAGAALGAAVVKAELATDNPGVPVIPQVVTHRPEEAGSVAGEDVAVAVTVSTVQLCTAQF